MTIHSADIVVVGSGPGGATVARQVARANTGLRVLLLERGRDWRRNPLYGTYPGAMLYTDKASFLSTQEGLSIVRPLMLGGATSMYCGCASLPLPWWNDKYGIDLSHYATETVDELAIAPLPPDLRGTAATRIAEAADAIGQSWAPQAKFMSPARSKRFDCRATCMLGCRCGAKWSAAEYVDEAGAAGAEVWTGATAKTVLSADNQVTGVMGVRGRKPFTVHASAVVVAAGGIGTPRLLQRSGLTDAGHGMTMDTTVMVYGHAPYKGIGNEPPMTWSYADDELGAMYSTLIDPWLNYPVAMVRKGPAYALTWRRWGHTLGVMIKLEDEVSGHVGARTISKGLTDRDRQRLAQAETVARRILRQAGCAEDSLFMTPLRGTHPSGTARIGALVSAELETPIANLFVCDASVFPQALARPTVLTIIALGKRLGDHLVKRLAPAASPVRLNATG